MPQQSHSNVTAIPKQFLSDRTSIPQQYHSDTPAIPQQSHINPRAPPKQFHCNPMAIGTNPTAIQEQHLCNSTAMPQTYYSKPTGVPQQSQSNPTEIPPYFHNNLIAERKQNYILTTDLFRKNTNKRIENCYQNTLENSFKIVPKYSQMVPRDPSWTVTSKLDPYFPIFQRVGKSGGSSLGSPGTPKIDKIHSGTLSDNFFYIRIKPPKNNNSRTPQNPPDRAPAAAGAPFSHVRRDT